MQGVRAGRVRVVHVRDVPFRGAAADGAAPRPRLTSPPGRMTRGRTMASDLPHGVDQFVTLAWTFGGVKGV
ncbi:hypothetical protein SLNHY_2063 [Streptomyces albus]|nr:hypothetical protein SLNHY_2063 [Streptomyces albus]